MNEWIDECGGRGGAVCRNLRVAVIETRRTYKHNTKWGEF
jgi:hypothetical protein